MRIELPRVDKPSLYADTLFPWNVDIYEIPGAWLLRYGGHRLIINARRQRA